MGIHDMLGYWLEQDKDDAIKQAQLELLQNTLEKEPLDNNNNNDNDNNNNGDTQSDDGNDPDAQTDDEDKQDPTLISNDIIIPELIEETIFERLVDLLDQADGEGVKGEEFFIKYGYGGNGTETITTATTSQPAKTSGFSLPWSNTTNRGNYNTTAGDANKGSSESVAAYSRPRTPFDQQQKR